MNLTNTSWVHLTATPDSDTTTHGPGRPATRWWEPAVLPGRWSAVGFVVVAGLLAAHLVVVVLWSDAADFPGRDPLERLFGLDGEMGLPAWFSGLLLFLCAQALWLLSDTSRNGSRRRWARHERVLSVVFLYLSLDEVSSIHEQTIYPLREALDLDGPLFFAWVVLFVPLTLLLGVFFVGYVRALPRAAAVLVVLSGVVYVGGAAGVEMLGSVLYIAGDVDSVTYAVVITFEEGMEMVGALLFLSTVVWLRTGRARTPTPGTVATA